MKSLVVLALAVVALLLLVIGSLAVGRYPVFIVALVSSLVNGSNDDTVISAVLFAVRHVPRLPRLATLVRGTESGEQFSWLQIGVAGKCRNVIG